MSDERSTQGNDAKLKRDIGMLAAIFLVFNGVIGAGIFGLPGKLAEQAGMFSPWLILIFGALILTVVWSFASMASYFNNTGGPVAYASRAFGPLVGFQTGWLLYFGRIASIAANLNLLFTYAEYFWDGMANETTKAIMFCFIIGALAIINIMGIKRAVQAINIITFLKAIPIIGLILIGLPHVSPAGLLPGDFPVVDDVGALVLLILYAFVGFEGALVTAGETKDPKKTLPVALFSTVIIISIVYFLIQLIYVNTVIGGNNDAPLIALGQFVLGTTGAVIITLTAIFSIMGNATSIMIAVPRMTFAMAEDGSLPGWFSQVHEKYKTPMNSILFLSFIAIILGLTGTFVYLATASALSRMVAYGVCIASLPAIKRKADLQTRDEATNLPGGNIIPIIAILVCILAAVLSPLISWLYFCGFFALGSFLYFINYLLKRKAA
ncbi:MAG: amino acid permease [Kordiimonadaceae bacterium]|jgi:basic amino acid/polyamine antiporter, APA family|nr:amino acid permease [Kordiimonadaceae bacterium]